MTYSFHNDSLYTKKRRGIWIRNYLYEGVPVIALRHKRIPRDLDLSLKDKELSKVAVNLIRAEKPDVVQVAHSMRVSELVHVLRTLKTPYAVMLTDFFLVCPKYTLMTTKNGLCAGPEGGRACLNLCPELPIDYLTTRLNAAGNILYNAQVVTALSGFFTGIFENEFPDLEIKVVNPGLKYSNLKSNMKIYAKEERIVFSYLGSLTHHKGVHILIDAFRKLDSETACLKIYGSGDEPYLSHLKEIAKDDRRILFCGVYSQDQLGDILRSTDVVIAPSLWYETYCLVLHEALACKVPVIASDVGAMADRIEDRVNGFLFRMGDPQHLREVLQQIVDNPSILNGLKRNINLMVIPSIEEEAYTYERICEQIAWTSS
jgi:glycosyltransferase involved in cell wall biosynthesis